jgi:hypothetical protein
MAEFLQQAQDPDFVPATPTPSNNPTSQGDQDFIPASPAQSATSPSPTPTQADPDFIPAQMPEQEGNWFSTITNGIKNAVTNVGSTQHASEGLLAIYHGDLKGFQHSERNNLVQTLMPFLSDKQIDENVENTPDEGIIKGKGAWETTKSVANLPLGGIYHRKGAGPIEGETEDWITGQLNPLNIGLAVASMGGTVIESALVKGGLSAARAAGIVRYSKLAVDLGFLSKFGYSTYTEAIPKFEQDWADYNNEKDPSKKSELLDKLEREGTDTVLGSLAAGLATRGIESDIHEIRTESPKGKAAANTEYANAIHEYQAENQVGSGQAHQVHREGVAAVPDALRQDAMSNNVEANADLKQLRQWEADAGDDQKPGYKAAQSLTDKEMSVRDRLRSMLDAWKMRLRDQNLLASDGGRDNYVPHRPVFEDQDPVTGEPVSQTAADVERGFLKKRVYPSHAEGEQAGIKYKTKSFIKLVSDYIERASNMIARNNLGESLANARMNEGSPMAVSGGYLGVPRDAPLTPADIQQLQREGKFDQLLKVGRIYEAKPGTTGSFQVPGTPPPPVPAPAGYTPSEKASNMSARQSSDLGKEFTQGEQAHEAERLKGILRDSNASPEDKAMAQQRSNEGAVLPDFIPHEIADWANEVKPTKKVNGFWTEDPSTPKIIFAAEKALSERGFPPENIVKLRKMAMDKVGTGPKHAEAYAKMLQEAIRNHDAIVASPESTTDRMVNKGLIPRGEFPPGYHDAQDSTTGGSVNVKKGAGDTTIMQKVEDHRAAIGDVSQMSDVAQGKAAEASNRYEELVKQRNGGQSGPPAPPKVEKPPLVGGNRPTNPVYNWKFSDYRDSGLRVNRPTANVDSPQNAIVSHPDQNAFPGEAILRQGEGGGIPTDPRTGQPMARVPVYVHPEITPHLNAVLDSTAPKSALVRGALKVSGAAKSVLLSMSPFHWFTVATRALEANPVGGLGSVARNFANVVKMPTPVDYFNLTDKQMSAIRDGLVVGNTRPGFSGYTEEGNVAGAQSFASRLPIVGKLNHWIESRLFGPQGFITGMKFDLHEQLKGELTSKGIPDEQAGRIAAAQVNNKFGGLNYTLLGRSAGTQAALRASLLAPDFLESTGRSVMDVAGKHGQGLVKALVAFNLVHYLTARALNYVVNGSLHPESGFKVLSPDGKKEYGIRTTLGDFLHFAEHPRDFMMNRVNPLLVRTPMELIQGVDQQGNKVSNTQRMWDTVRQVTPIPLQSLTPKQQISQPSRVDDILKGLGVQSTKKFSPAESLAYQRATSRNQGQPLEGDALEKAQNKFRMADALRSSIVDKDANGIKSSTQDIIKAAKGNDPLISYAEANTMIQDAHKYKTRLESTIQRLPLEDALDTWDAASMSERHAIRMAVNSKIDSWYKQAGAGKKSPKQIQAMLPRVRKYFTEKP